MELRAILTPPVLDEDEVRRMTVLVEEIYGHMHFGKTPTELIAAFNEFSGEDYNDRDFHNAFGAIGPEELVRDVLTPEAPWITDISREEYLEIIRRMIVEMPKVSHDYYWLSSLLHRNLSHPEISSLIFSEGNTPEEALDKMLMHKPIAL